LSLRLGGEDQMSQMGRIKRAAEESDAERHGRKYIAS
jgi:hypothetical protein